LSLRSDDLDSVSELYIQDDLRQLVVTIEATPAFLGGLGELKDEDECGLVRETALRAGRAMADGREGAFDDICNRYEISRCQCSAAVFYIVAYGATIGTAAPGARSAGRPIHTMSRELELVAGRLCDSAGCAESANP
jgi:hypothetical protein